MNELKPCPFCGSKIAPRLSTIYDCEMCSSSDAFDICPCYENESDDGCMHIVVCSMNDGGCGTSTGWRVNKEQAIESWNRRVKE